MNCYFCNVYLGTPEKYKATNHPYTTVLNCTACHTAFNEDYVQHTIVNGELWFVDIFTTIKNREYVVNLSIKDNQTTIFLDPNDASLLDENVLILEGFPITFNNVKNKLRTYLLFS
jgi:hypothetical protein